MARSITNVSNFKSLTEKGNLEARPIGGRILPPGKYTFAADPEVKYNECNYPRSNRTYLHVEVKSNRAWVDLGLLLKLAVALAGHTLEVSRQRVETYSIYRDGQRCDPYVNGWCYKARIVDTADQGK